MFEQVMGRIAEIPTTTAGPDILQLAAKIGAAWDELNGGSHGLCLQSVKGHCVARWGISHKDANAVVAVGSTLTAAVEALIARLASDVQQASTEDGIDLCPALAASLALVEARK
jgi:hypothetical protein